MSEEDQRPDSPEESAAQEASPAAEPEAAAAGDQAYSPDSIAAGQSPTRGADLSLDVVMDVPVNVALRVGQTAISIRQLISLVEGSVIELDRDATDPMDVLVNDTLVARGEIVVVDDKFGVRLTDVVSPGERIGTLN